MFRLSQSNRKKGQWYLISAVMISGAFLVISVLFKNYYIVDSSSSAMLNEDYFFWNIQKGFNDTIDNAGYDQPSCINLNRRLDEYIAFSEKQMAEKGYYLFMNKSISCSDEEVEHGILLTSSVVMLYYNVVPDEIIR